MAKITNPVTEIASAIRSGIEYLTLLLKTSSVRRMTKAIEAAERYIMINEKDGEYSELIDRPELQKKQLAKYRKRFFRYN